MIRPINSIINRPILKNFALATMLTASSITLNSCVNKKVDSNNIDLVTQECANISVAKPIYSDIRNSKVINKALNLYDAEIEKEYQREKMAKIFAESGTFLGVIKIQRKIDDYVFSKSLEQVLQRKYLKDWAPDGSVSMYDNKSPLFHIMMDFREYVDYDYLPKFEVKESQFENMPSFQEVDSLISDFIAKTDLVTVGQKQNLEVLVKDFKSKQQPTLKNLPLAQSDLIAFKLHTINGYVYENTLKRVDIFNMLSKKEYKEIIDIYNKQADVRP